MDSRVPDLGFTRHGYLLPLANLAYLRARVMGDFWNTWVPASGDNAGTTQILMLLLAEWPPGSEPDHHQGHGWKLIKCTRWRPKSTHKFWITVLFYLDGPDFKLDKFEGNLEVWVAHGYLFKPESIPKATRYWLPGKFLRCGIFERTPCRRRFAARLSSNIVLAGFSLE